MTNKEKALRLVWEHYRIDTFAANFEEFKKRMIYTWVSVRTDINHAKLTASKIAEYNPEEGKVLLEELEKI